MLAKLKSTIYNKLISGKQKALVAFVVAGVGSYLARHGFTFNASLVSYLQAAGLGLLAHLGVYFKKNN